MHFLEKPLQLGSAPGQEGAVNFPEIGKPCRPCQSWTQKGVEKIGEGVSSVPLQASCEWAHLTPSLVPRPRHPRTAQRPPSYPARTARDLKPHGAEP